MNKKGDIEDYAPLIFVGVLILIFLFLIFAFSDTTVNSIQIKIKDGKIIEGKIEEKSIDRIDLFFGDEYENGFYNILIEINNQLIRKEESIGAGEQTYYIKRFMECVDITLFDSYTENKLDEKEICKK